MIRTPLPRLVGAAAPLRAYIHLPAAFRYPDYRNYWMGLLLSVIGYQMLVSFSLGWLITVELDKDVRYLSYMGPAIAVPTIVLNLFGGVLADKFDPKRLIGFAQFSSGVVAVVLGLLVLRDIIEPWHVLVAASIKGALQAFDNPGRQSIYPRLIDREALPSAIAMNSGDMERDEDYRSRNRGSDNQPGKYLRSYPC